MPRDYPVDADPTAHWQIVTQFHDQPSLAAGALAAGEGEGKVGGFGLGTDGLCIGYWVVCRAVHTTGQSWDVFPPHNSSIALYLLNRAEDQGKKEGKRRLCYIYTDDRISQSAFLITFTDHPGGFAMALGFGPNLPKGTWQYGPAGIETVRHVCCVYHCTPINQPINRINQSTLLALPFACWHSLPPTTHRAAGLTSSFASPGRRAATG